MELTVAKQVVDCGAVLFEPLLVVVNICLTNGPVVGR